MRRNIKEALKREFIIAELKFHVINEAESKCLGLMGSPSVLINGTDIMPGEIPGFS